MWIPVNDINDIALVVSKVSGINENSEVYLKTNYQGRLYDFTSYGSTEKTNYGQGTLSFKEPDVITGSGETSYDASSTYLAILGLESSSKFSTQLQEEFNEMIESIDTYGGFYIGRYETGNLSATANTEPVVVKGNASISSVNWYYMYQNSKLIAANDNVVSTMIWGCLWDRTLIWLTETGDKTYAEIADSISWGNYTRNTEDGAGTVKTTGYSETWKANNIYDLAGNVWEMTIESYSYYGRVSRGGYYGSSSYPVSHRNSQYATSGSSTRRMSCRTLYCLRCGIWDVKRKISK